MCVVYFIERYISYDCYNVNNKCTQFVRIIIMFQYTHSQMFWALLANHQGVSCIKQSSNPSIISSV